MFLKQYIVVDKTEWRLQTKICCYFVNKTRKFFNQIKRILRSKSQYNVINKYNYQKDKKKLGKNLPKTRNYCCVKLIK